MTSVSCFACMTPGGAFISHTILRRACGPDDVVIDIKFAGICHSDIHTARDDWGPANYPLVPGHEIGGLVTQVGENVKKFSVGDTVGVGCMVDSCRACQQCKAGEEQYCDTGAVYTYNSTYKYSHSAEYTPEGGNVTYGGYSKAIVVDESFVLRIPNNLDLAAATPLLCAGITVYSPMKYFGLKPTDKFGVVGLGGLGHMAVKFGVAYGNHTSVISRGTSKRDTCINELHAHDFIDSTNAEQMKGAGRTFDFLICTVSAQYDIQTYLNLLKPNGKFIVVGAPSEPVSLGVFGLIPTRRTIAGSLIGGIQETQEMLDFCGVHNIVCDIETISASQINVAYDRTVAGDVRYRFVIDTATI